MDCGHPWPLRAESPAVLEYSWSLAGPPRLVRCPWSPWICAMFSWWLESTKAGCVIGDPIQFQDPTEPDLILMNSNDVCNSSIKIKGCRRPLCELQVMTELSHARSWFTWVSKSRRVWSQKKTVSISEASEVWSCNLIRTQLHHLDHVRLTSYNIVQPHTSTLIGMNISPVSSFQTPAELSMSCPPRVTTKPWGQSSQKWCPPRIEPPMVS